MRFEAAVAYTGRKCAACGMVELADMAVHTRSLPQVDNLATLAYRVETCGSEMWRHRWRGGGDVALWPCCWTWCIALVA